MSQVHINGRGHEVTVQHDGAELDYVIQKARQLWNDTRPEPKDVGFSAEPFPSLNGGGVLRG